MFDAVALLERLTAHPMSSESATVRAVAEAPAVEPVPTFDDLPGDWRVWYEERAAIREYDGGQAREHAEAEALREALDAMRRAGENLYDTI